MGLIDKLICDYRGAKILFSAVALDLFSYLEKNSASLDVLSEDLGIMLRPTKLLLEALIALGFIKKRAGKFSNTPISKKYLVKNSSLYLGDNLKYQNILWNHWGELDTILKSGAPSRPLTEFIKGEVSDSFLEGYINGMRNIARPIAKEVAKFLRLRNPDTMLDVGAGPGAYTEELLKKHPKLKSDLLDLPDTISLARNILSTSKCANRIQYIPGDYHTYDFKKDGYDLVFISHVTHNEGPDANRLLIKKAHAALRPGGSLAIHDFMTNGEGVPRIFPALFSVHMMIYTKEGQCYSQGEYKKWMEEFGFSHLVFKKIARENVNSTYVLVGRKEGL